MKQTMNKRKRKTKYAMLTYALLFGHLLAFGQSASKSPNYNINTDKLVYTIGYTHLDTEWNWDYPLVINEYIKNIMTENFSLFEKFPGYKFNFTGSRRYHMMKEYYPELYKKVGQYVANGQWMVSGSSVDESDCVMSTPESVIRQVLYGNQFFKKEFGKESKDYMLPDCFGFPASLPTILRHAGLIGFSTQKLSWGSAVGIPFNVGMWYGPDGSGLASALNGGAYVSNISTRFDLDDAWSKRLDANKQKTGYGFDFHYYGVGDQGGAPRENDVKHALGSQNNADSKFKVLLTSSDQLFKDLSPQIRKSLPTYTGDLLLTEHSAGSLTSQAFMKKMNRKNELLAKAAEQLAVVADWKGLAQYPYNKINNAWELVLGSQVHDVLPGTSIPKAYEYAWNDEYVAANGFANILTHAATVLANNLDTRVDGKAIVVYNPLAIAREDVVEAEASFDAPPENLTVTGPDNRITPVQIIKKEGNKVRFIFLAKVPSVGMAVFAVKVSPAAKVSAQTLKVSNHSLENEYYKIEINSNGDIATMFDKQNNRELLTKPARLDFQSEKSYVWPAWNMMWDERQKPPFAHAEEVVSVKVVENGPVRIAVEVKRKALNSEITQVLSLSAGASGKRVEINNLVDWQSKGVSMKASFPLAASNENTTYNMGVGTVERGINNEKKYEVPSQQWFDQTEKNGKFGVSILEDCKYGSDKPDANTLRLTLMFTPKPDKRYVVQGSQDWGMHQFKYGIYGHNGNWQDALTPWQGACLNQPMIAFEAGSHNGKDGRSTSFLQLSTTQVGLMAYKKMENQGYYVVRVNELFGKNVKNAAIKFPAKITDAFEIDGQENRLGTVSVNGQNLQFDINRYAVKAFAVKFAPTTGQQYIAKQTPVALLYNNDAFSFDTNRNDGNMDGRNSIPADLVADSIVSEDVTFKMGSRKDEALNAVTCKGQKIDLPQGDYNTVYILAAAIKDDVKANFAINDKTEQLTIQNWSGYIGQFYNRHFEQDEITVKSISSPFVKNSNVAWFASHRHLAYPSKNEAYNYSYMFKYKIKLPKGAKTISLPNNEAVKIFAITVANEGGTDVVPLQPIYDNFDYATKVSVR
jgi:alpha-mannosidase